MIINPYSTYCEAEILPLYKAVGWSNYYDHPEMLQKAYAGSLCTLAAYEGEKLIGIIRCVGDGYSILHRHRTDPGSPRKVPPCLPDRACHRQYGKDHFLL